MASLPVSTLPRSLSRLSNPRSSPYTRDSTQARVGIFPTWVVACNIHNLCRYSVRGTVRTQDKANKIAIAYPEYKERLDFIIVEDITKPGAFHQAVVSEPPFDYILHTATPVTFKFTDVKLHLINPAVRGTLEILEAAKNYAPSVKRVVCTKSVWCETVWD